MCVFVAFGIQHAMSNISPHYLIKGKILEKKNRAPSSILHEAKRAYYACNMFEAARLVFFVKST